MRKAIIAGNWKMNNTIEESLNLVKELKPLVKDAEAEVIVCPSFLSIKGVIDEVKGTNIKVGAQNMHFEENGAFTGEISPNMLNELGVDYVIIGHSERRQYFNETDCTINKKLKSSFKHNIIPILCVGETLEEKESGITKEVIGKQIKLDLYDISREEVENMVVAYEPIWAIGTGKTATSEEANATIKFIRSILEELYGTETSDKVRILYGGSVKPSTIKEQMAKSDIDGSLVGGASLKAKDFSEIVNY
ncbi:triose-phosphate isomerase [Hathewaya histolytica]|uniref:Triosephosphate isomerase n=1 Tax=Hathewaya histolytica TaxID=1498 RepID=A0A4U9R2A6_HATHI|nr:triose-phosphate isomerase [Hathewaya histolytica]VTQ85139.1 triosephosphate isomerase [Hathewaya histolytica]